MTEKNKSELTTSDSQSKPNSSATVTSKPTVEPKAPVSAKPAAAKVTAEESPKKVIKKAAKKVVKQASKPVSKPVVSEAKQVAKKAAKKATKKISTAAKSTKKKAAASAKTASKKTQNAVKKSSDQVEQRLAQVQALLHENLQGLSGEKAEQMARNIWLAGLGVYSRTYEELSDRYDNAQDRYEEINSEGQQLIDELVERGKLMQQDFEIAVNERKSSMESRVEELKERFGGLNSFVDIPGRLKDAADRIEEFSQRIRKKD